MTVLLGPANSSDFEIDGDLEVGGDISATTLDVDGITISGVATLGYVLTGNGTKFVAAPASGSGLTQQQVEGLI